MGVLAMSRAIGDTGLRPYVIPEPEITVVTRSPDDEFLLLASDGLWDVFSNADAAGHRGGHGPADLCEKPQQRSRPVKDVRPEPGGVKP
ncbi:hypothetical protein FOA52_013638 [Chlamydomonas sp. UWO 241]|nr:hypothetical protein FOA52_013638 [Chlamydomonas sp. UWO 241]